MSYQFSLGAKDRASARFISLVRKALQKAFVARRDEHGLTQAELGRLIDKKPEQISRWLHGTEALSLRTIAELSWALEYEPKFSLEEVEQRHLHRGQNHQLKTQILAMRTLEDAIGSDAYSSASPKKVITTYGA